MPEKNIPDVIQNILDKNKGFMRVKDIPALMSLDIKRQLGLKRNSSASVVMKKLENILEDRFIFRKKGSTLYILTPSLPSDIVLSSLPTDKPISPKVLARSLPFTATDFMEIMNDLVSSGKARIILNDKLAARIIATTSSQDIPVQTSGTNEYSQEKFRSAFEALDRGRRFVRICDLRRKLGWPREIFDGMLRSLRDERVIDLHTLDASTMTTDDVGDSFVDENGFRKGSVTWHVR